MARASATYAQRRERLLPRLASAGAGDGASGLNVWVPVREEAGAVGALMQRGWVVAPGEPYQLPERSPAIRVTSATLTEREAARLADDVADVLAPGAFSRIG